MDNVELHFRDLDSDQDVSRKYPACTLEDAFQKFKDEFPDESKRPRVFRVSVEHIQINVV